jgi:hypothetical protein
VKSAIIGIKISQEHGYSIGAIMAEEMKPTTVTLEELMVSTLATTDALAKLMIAKGIITDEEFKAQLIKCGAGELCRRAEAITLIG